MLRGEQVRFLVLPILAPALLVSRRLMLLRQTRKQVGMAGRDAFLHKRLSYAGMSCNRLRRA